MENPQVKDVKIDIGLLGDIDISVTEAKPIALFLFDNKYYVCSEIGKVYVVKQKIKTIPQCLGFKTLNMFKNFSKEYCQINSLIRNDVSDIIYFDKEKDPLFIKMILVDHNEIWVRINEMREKLNSFDYNAYKTKYKGYYFSFEGQYLYVDKLSK